MTKSWGKHFNENRDNEQEQWLPNQPNNITEQSPTVRIWWYGLLPDSLARHTSLNLPTNLPAFWPTHPPRPLPMYQLMYQSKEGNREKEGCTLHLSQWRNKIWTKEQESLRKAHVVWNEPMPGQTDRQTVSWIDFLTHALLEFQLNVLSKSAWVVIHQSLSISKSFQQRIHLMGKLSIPIRLKLVQASCNPSRGRCTWLLLFLQIIQYTYIVKVTCPKYSEYCENWNVPSIHHPFAAGISLTFSGKGPLVLTGRKNFLNWSSLKEKLSCRGKTILRAGQFVGPVATHVAGIPTVEERNCTYMYITTQCPLPLTQNSTSNPEVASSQYTR